MIIDAHTHFTTAPAQLQAYRGQQITNLAKPIRAKLNISDEELARSMQGQLNRMKEGGIDRLMFSPQAGAMGHHFGSPPVCQLPQSPGVSPSEWADELDRCVNDLGFVGCNVNPDVAGGREPLTPSMG